MILNDYFIGNSIKFYNCKKIHIIPPQSYKIQFYIVYFSIKCNNDNPYGSVYEVCSFCLGVVYSILSVRIVLSVTD